MALTAAQIILEARLWARDTSTTLPAFTDAQYLTMLNAVFGDYYNEGPNPPTIHSSNTVLFNGANPLISGARFVAIATTVTDIGDPLQLFQENNATAKIGPPIERVSESELLFEQATNESGDTADAGFIRKVSIARQYIAPSAGRTMQWIIRLWPVLSQTSFVSMIYRPQCPTLIATDTPDLMDAEARCLARVVGAKSAMLRGVGESVVNASLSGLGETWQKLATAGKFASTQPRGSDRP